MGESTVCVEKGKREIMTEIKIICANLIEKNGTFLLVKEAKKSAEGLYNFPAGKLDGNETIIEGAIREAKEETGLTVQPINLVGVYQRPVGRKGDNVTVIVFKSNITSGKTTPTEKHPEVKFFSYGELKEMERKGLLRSQYIMKSITDHKEGKLYDLSVIKTIKE